MMTPTILFGRMQRGGNRAGSTGRRKWLGVQGRSKATIQMFEVAGNFRMQCQQRKLLTMPELILASCLHNPHSPIGIYVAGEMGSPVHDDERLFLLQELKLYVHQFKVQTT